jgi:hypothetical protein
MGRIVHGHEPVEEHERVAQRHDDGSSLPERRIERELHVVERFGVGALRAQSNAEGRAGEPGPPAAVEAARASLPSRGRPPRSRIPT